MDGSHAWQVISVINILICLRRSRYKRLDYGLEMLIWEYGSTKGWFDCTQVSLPLTWVVTRTPRDAELCHYLQLFQSYMTHLVCQKADCICEERTKTHQGQLERLSYLILTINPAKHEKHSGGESDRAVTAVKLLMWPLRLCYKVTMSDFLYITCHFLRRFMHW